MNVPCILTAVIVGMFSLAGCFRFGGGGEMVCSEPAECVTSCRDDLVSLSSPGNPPAPFSAAHCQTTTIGSWSGVACACESEGGHLIVGGPPDQCAVLGRANDCLYQNAEFPGCALDESASCDVVCADLQTRRVAEAEAALEIEDHGVTCRGGRCFCAFEHATECYLTAVPQAFSCSKDVETMVSEAFPSDR